MHFADKVLDHLLGDLEIGDHAITKRPARGDVAGGAAEHLLGFLADRDHLLLATHIGDRDHRGFGQHDATTLDIDQGIGSSQVDGHVG
jgi:hypothetical protein